MTETLFEGAFPSGRMSIGDGDAVAYERGMTLRDYFAGQVVAGMLADPEMNATPEEVAEYAYSIADAMLAARAGAVK